MDIKRAGTILSAAAFLALAGCQKQDDSVIRVGEYASLTGKEAAFGQSCHKGTLLAIEELNAGGGLLGKKLELRTEDDASTQGQPATIVKKLISRDKVIAVLGEATSSRDRKSVV